MEKWRNGEMEKWRNGEMEKWRNGEMEKWRNGGVNTMPDIAPIRSAAMKPFLIFELSWAGLVLRLASARYIFNKNKGNTPCLTTKSS